jgi:8-oxo-dGTP diphosphatase
MSIIHVAAAIIIQNEKVLIAKRPEGKHKAGYWEFPGGKVEANETAEQALLREIHEELDIEIATCEFFKSIQFDYPEKKVRLEFFKVSKFKGTPKGMEGQLIEWVEINKLNNYQFPEANLDIVEKLQR